MWRNPTPLIDMRLITHGPMTKLQVSPHLQPLPPVGHFDMLALMRRCSPHLSEPGGLQEEVTAPSIGKFCIVLRTSTERPGAVGAGHARVMGFEKEAIWREMEERAGKGRPSEGHPYGTGDAARKIVEALEECLEKSWMGPE